MRSPVQEYESNLIAKPDRDSLRQMMFHHFLEKGINTREELKFWVEEYTGYFLAAKKICPEHTSPMDFLSDQFFETVQTSIGFANRGGGKTAGVAVLNIVDSIMKDGIEIASAGAIQEQADRAYSIMTNLLSKEPLLEQMVIGSIKSETTFVNRSVVRIIPGTYHGFNSPHPNKTRIDEIELMNWEVLQEGLQMSIQKGKYKAQDTLTSTRKWQKGTMQRLLDESEKKGIKVYCWCIFEVLEKCTRQCFNDPVYGDCPVYSMKDKDGDEYKMCGGIAHNCSGWYKIQDFVKKGKLLDKDTWETQWRNLRPSGQVLVYGDYFKNDAPWVVEPFEVPQDWQRVSGIDFGSKFYYGKAAIDPRDETWYVFWEYYTEVERDLETHANIIKGSPGFNNRTEFIYADPSGKQAILELRKYGVSNLTPANNDLYAGINRVKSMFLRRGVDGLPKIRVFKWCNRLIEELSSLYCHKLEKDGSANKDAIVKKDDHAADTLRYMIYSYYTLQSSYKPKTVRNLY